MNMPPAEVPGPAPDAPVSKSEIIDRSARMLVEAIDLFADPDAALRKIITATWFNCDAIDNPYDTIDELEDETKRLNNVLRDIRVSIRKSDLEHALLLIHYETGDWQ
jgi:hypothetical protein